MPPLHGGFGDNNQKLFPEQLGQILSGGMSYAEEGNCIKTRQELKREEGGKTFAAMASAASSANPLC